MEKEDNITYIKGTYIWSFNKNFQNKIKMIKSINGNIKLQNMNIFKDNEEFILKPRCIINDPFDEDNSILISCDIIDLENTCNNYDERKTFLKEIQHFGKEIKKNDSKISFSQKFKINTSNIDLQTIANNLIKNCLSSNIEIDEIEIENDIINVCNKFTNALSACDELYFIRYIFMEISKKFKFEYKLFNNLSYKFLDDKTSNSDGIEFINKYIKNLKDKNDIIKKNEIFEMYHNEFKVGNNPSDNIFIPKSTFLAKCGYFVDNRFIADTDPYSIIYSNLNQIYS